MKVINLTRKFKYNSITLGDPNPGLSPDAVREFYATQYPELLNATIEGPVTSNEIANYTFVRSAGSKGRMPSTMPPAWMKLQSIVAGEKLAALDAPQSKTDVQMCDALLNVFSNNKPSRPLPIPSAAVGVWG